MMKKDRVRAKRPRTGTLWVKRIASVVVLVGLFWNLSPPVARGDIYWFQDEEGVVHISNVPVDVRFRFKEREKPKDVSKILYEKRRGNYARLIEEVARDEGVDSELLRAVVATESNYDPNAISRKGALGLMQLMPETARGLGVTDPFHPAENLGGGARHLRRLIDKYQGELPLVLAAYNAGEQAVDRYNGIPPFPETVAYVEKVLRAYGKAGKERQAPGGEPRKDGS